MYRRHKQAWWQEPYLPPVKVRVPSRLKLVDPLSADHSLPHVPLTRSGAFLPNRKWAAYNRLHGIDTGYITTLYMLSEIAFRYGLSQNGTTYFRKHILPEPFTLVRRRSVSAHHWSRFTLMALDTVLLDLESRGYQAFNKKFEDHIALVHIGSKYLTEYYAERAENKLVDTSDKFGVQWY